MILSDLFDHLQTSKSKMGLKELYELHREIPRAVLTMGLDFTSILSTYQLLNLIHNEVMKRALELAEQEVTQGKRPKKLCWVQFGSGAREEQTVKTDQDHGLLYQCPPEDQEACASYVSSLALIGTTYLHKVGYPYCSGNVMAINERWSKEAHLWLEAINTHIRTGEPDDIKYLFIATDLKEFYGDGDLIQEVKTKISASLQSSPFLIKRMHQHLQTPKISRRLFGKLLVERFGEHSGKWNVKTGFYVPMVNAIKYLAINQGLTSTSTLGRLNHLQEHEGINPTLLKKIFEACLYFRLRASLTEERDYLDPATLTKKERTLLNLSLKQAKAFQTKLLRKGNGYE